MEEELIVDNNYEFTPSQIKELRNSISKLEKEELYEIFKIIKLDNEKYTENKNGIFINMSKLKTVTLHKLKNFVTFCQENKQSFLDNKEKLEEIKNIVNDSLQGNNNDNENNPMNLIHKEDDNEIVEIKQIDLNQNQNINIYQPNANIIHQELSELETELLKDSTNLDKINKPYYYNNQHQLKNRLTRRNYNQKISYRVAE